MDLPQALPAAALRQRGAGCPDHTPPLSGPPRHQPGLCGRIPRLEKPPGGAGQWREGPPPAAEFPAGVSHFTGENVRYAQELFSPVLLLPRTFLLPGPAGHLRPQHQKRECVCVCVCVCVYGEGTQQTSADVHADVHRRDTQIHEAHTCTCARRCTYVQPRRDPQVDAWTHARALGNRAPGSHFCLLRFEDSGCETRSAFPAPAIPALPGFAVDNSFPL